MHKDSRIIIPGAAGLVGQNLLIQLKSQGFVNILAIDKHKNNLAILKTLHPDVDTIEADLSQPGEWQDSFANADVVIMLQAQIGAKTIEPFIRNNVESTQLIISTMKKYKIGYIVHISSSVVNSKAEDFYTITKKQQEEIVSTSGLRHCVLRPTLMYGWFDRKHLGWLSRFMEKTPIFPIPGHGRYMRQPLYEKDFCRVIVSAMKSQPNNLSFNITGREEVDYIDIIRQIKKAKKLKTWIVKVPYSVFKWMMAGYGLFSSNPPFTTQQLEALVADDKFELIPWWDIFGVESTPFEQAIDETFNDPEYSHVILEF